MLIVLLFPGLICCGVGVLFFASPLTVLAQVIRTKNTESLPFPIIVSSFFVSLQWFVYGMLIEDSFIQVRELLKKDWNTKNPRYFIFRFQISWAAFCLPFNYCYTQSIPTVNCIRMVDHRTSQYVQMPMFFERSHKVYLVITKQQGCLNTFQISIY